MVFWSLPLAGHVEGGVELSFYGHIRYAPWEEKSRRGAPGASVLPKRTKAICKRIRNGVQSFETVLHSQPRVFEDVAKRYEPRTVGAQLIIVASEDKRETWMSRFAS